MAGFRNTRYKDEWKKYVGNSDKEYADGTYFKDGDRYAVYDGAQNYMGHIDKAGTFTTDSPVTEYKSTFLRSAKDELIKNGLISAMTGDKV